MSPTPASIKNAMVYLGLLILSVMCAWASLATALGAWNLSGENRISLLIPVFAIFGMSILTYRYLRPKGKTFGFIGPVLVSLFVSLLLHIKLLLVDLAK